MVGTAMTITGMVMVTRRHAWQVAMRVLEAFCL